MERLSLPIDDSLTAICEAVRANPITIIEAPPGSGKTTRVAPALLKDLFAESSRQRIYLLQPRRLAARSVAQRIAFEDQSQLGQSIGYQVRFDNQVSRSTQLIVATEGILLRRLQDDAAISDTSIVILDEFHERSLDADLLLGMLRRVQQTLRDDLRIVIMSATLDAATMQSQLDNAPIIRVSGQSYPVAIHYRPAKFQERLVDQTIAVVTEVVERHEGDVLVFLPGAGEILRCRDELGRTRIGREVDIVPLYGAMQLEDQTRAIEMGARRKIVLATNVAETSLTIEGIRVVVDSGMARVMRFSPDVGLDRLSLEPISAASATQRTGRAGRVAAGHCYRLWNEASDRSRAPFLEPEVRRVDIGSAMLQLFAWGEGDSPDFPWLESPRQDSVQSSVRLLELLGAVHNGKVTSMGKQMAALPLHPRLSRMAIEGWRLGCLPSAALMAAMLSERDPFERNDGGRNSRGMGIPTHEERRWESDCVERVFSIQRFLATGANETPFGNVHNQGARNIAATAKQIAEQCESLLAGENASRMGRSNESEGQESEVSEGEGLMRALLAGFPDRVAKRRSLGKPNGLMVGGKGVQLSPQSGVRDSDLFVCVDIAAGAGDAVVRQASHVALEWLPEELMDERDELFFHPTQKQVVARRRLSWCELVLNETPTAIKDNAACAKTLFAAAKANWEQIFPVDDEVLAGFVQRVGCLREWLPDVGLPAVDREMLEQVALDLCGERRSFAELKSAPWLDWLQSRFTSEQLSLIEREAPARLTVPSGSSIKLQYELGKAPLLAVKIQEVFSMRDTPRVAMGRVPVLLHLLSPAMRPQQITNDIASFWKNGYPMVKKELKRRYPKHSWPDDPTTAPPGRR